MESVETLVSSLSRESEAVRQVTAVRARDQSCQTTGSLSVSPWRGGVRGCHPRPSTSNWVAGVVDAHPQSQQGRTTTTSSSVSGTPTPKLEGSNPRTGRHEQRNSQGTHPKTGSINPVWPTQPSHFTQFSSEDREERRRTRAPTRRLALRQCGHKTAKTSDRSGSDA